MVLARLLRAGLTALVQRSWSAYPAKILRDGPVSRPVTRGGLGLCPPGQIEEPHPERLPLDLDQGLLHRAPDGLPGASSDHLPGDAIAREAQEEQQGVEPHWPRGRPGHVQHDPASSWC